MSVRYSWVKVLYSRREHTEAHLRYSQHLDIEHARASGRHVHQLCKLPHLLRIHPTLHTATSRCSGRGTSKKSDCAGVDLVKLDVRHWPFQASLLYVEGEEEATTRTFVTRVSRLEWMCASQKLSQTISYHHKLIGKLLRNRGSAEAATYCVMTILVTLTGQ